MKSAANANLQNSINTSIILHYIRNKGAVYRSEISKALNLSLPAVSRAVHYLLEQGFLTEKRIVTGTGKKAHEVEINGSFGLFVGISIGLPIIRFSRMNMAGQIIDTHQVSVSNHVGELEDFILIEIKKYLQNIPIGLDETLPVLAVCLSVPAAVDQEKGRIHAVLFQRFGGLTLQQRLEKDLGVPVFMENNENLAAHAEKYYGDGVTENTFIFVTIHQGTGAGLIVDGRSLRGADGAAGEFGCQPLLQNGITPMEPKETYETVSSIHRVQKIAVDIIQAGRGAEIFRAANYDYKAIDHILIGRMGVEGSVEALEVLSIYVKHLAGGIANLLVIINPQCLILGGFLWDIPEAKRLIAEPLSQELESLLPFPVPPIRMTRLGREASVIGAAQYALENTIFKDYPYVID